MKAAILLAVLSTTFVYGEDTTSPLTFTYQTLTGGSVVTATTTYSLKNTIGASSSSVKTTQSASVKPGHHAPWGWGWPWGSTKHSAPWQQYETEASWPRASWAGVPWAPHRSTAAPSSAAASKTSPTTTAVHATRYTVNPSDLAYPTFSNVSAALADSPAAPGLMNATQFVAEALQLIELFKNANATNCQTCKTVMSGVAASMRVQQETLGNIAEPFCRGLPVIPYPICIGLLKIASNDIGGIFPAMNMQGEDGQVICAFMFGLCSLPAPPQLDLKSLFKGTTKPAAQALVPSTKQPLKVLHISDYHLDMRYVVGSEANCKAPLCCRVFPYTNTSAPINESASLFGNYLCDTPEPLATSVFRAVPKVTGYEWNNFSFAIFTGDIVSHDLWELTPEYVIAEELETYQQFFDGMGGVTMYPTLGNHDTYPHAFTAFPSENGVLPYNASYPVEQQYNYEAVSKAWANYGWLSAAEAQSVVASGLGIYRAVTKEGLVIISLNSDVWYYFNIYAYIGANVADSTGMMATLIDYLLDAESKGQAVWLIQHVNVGGSTDYEALPAASDLYYQIVDRFNNTIRGTFYGHTHSDELGVFYSNNATVQNANTAAAVAYIMPSVTPFTNLNAGFRYYLVDPETFAVIDSLTYYANISDAGNWTKNGDVTWEFEYSARATYDPHGTLGPNEPLSPAFWHSVTQQIATNASLYETYTDLRTKKYRPYTADTAQVRNRTLCGLTSMSVPIFERCLGSMASTSSFL